MDPEHRTLRRPAGVMLFALLFAAGSASCGSCRDGGGSSSSAGTSREAERAAALLDPDATLPPRPEVVAIADAIAIESSRKGKTAEGGGLARLAGDLRARLWRLDQSMSDAREALELY